MHISGACFCKAIVYEAEIDPDRVAICHCRDCQIFSGSAFRLASLSRQTDFKITQGSPKEFDKTSDSGNIRRSLFCGDCGTHIASIPDPSREPDGFVSIRVANADQFHELRPTKEVYCSSQTSWQPSLEGTRRVQRMR